MEGNEGREAKENLQFTVNLQDFLLQLNANKDQNIRVLMIGSGSARNLYKYLKSTRSNRMIFDYVNYDKEDQYIEKIRNNFNQFIDWHSCNIFYFKFLEEYDLIWNIGMFDSLTETNIIYLLMRFYSKLKANGNIWIGEFSESNYKKLTELSIGAGIPEHSIRFVNNQNNLFLNITKKQKDASAIINNLKNGERK